jgi:hypothetical protein
MKIFNRFSDDGFLDLCKSNSAAYGSAEPFPSICFDDVFDPAVLHEVLNEFPTLGELSVKNGAQTVRYKGHESDIGKMGQVTREFILALNSPGFLLALEELTGIDGLIPDPYLYGGGLHCTGSGGFLKVHADFNYHKKLKLRRRINVLVYLNEGWRPEWGGQIELWSKDMLKKVKGFDPVFNRMVIFSTDSDTFHGHPDPMVLPDNVFRRSIAMYYYTNAQDSLVAAEPRGKHTTIYRERPGESFSNGFPQKSSVASVFRKMLGLH